MVIFYCSFELLYIFLILLLVVENIIRLEFVVCIFIFFINVKINLYMVVYIYKIL